MREETGEQKQMRWRTKWWLIGGLVVLVLCGLAAAVTAAAWLWQSYGAVVGSLPAAVQSSPTLTPESGGTPEAAEGESANEAPAGANPGGGGRLVLVDSRRQVATIDGEGNNRRQLTDDDRSYQFPVWSPDGEWIAVLGSDDAGSGVYLLADAPARDSAPLSIYGSENDAPFYLYWSPDSQTVSILANHAGSLGLFLAAAGENGPARLLTTGQPFYWAWSPSADRLLIHTGANQEEARLAFIDPTGTKTGENLAAPGSFQSPGISASGAYWAFTVEDAAGARWLVIQNDRGESETRIPHRGTAALTWSPAADRLAFISPDSGGSDLFGPLRLYDAQTGQIALLTRQTVVAFFWSPDGRRLAFLTLHGRDSIEASAEMQPLAAIRPAERRAMQRDQLPTMDVWVVDVGSGNEGFVTSFTPTPLFLAQFLPFFDQYALSHRLWSPDSAALVLPVAENGVPHIMVIPVDGRRPRVVADGMIAFWRQQ